MSQDAPIWGTLPDKLFSVLLKDTVDLPDSDLIWPQVELDRRRIFQALVKRFYAQILHGCGHPHCQTPTCASCQKRTSKRPFRSFTILSARALALYLASQDRAEKILCPRLPLQTNPSKKKEKVSQGAVPSSGTVDPNRSSQYPPVESPVNARGADVARPEITNQKDPKSITQNLFDTAAAERFYTTLIPVRELFPRPEPKDRTTREDRSPTKEGPVILHGREEEQSGQYKDINQRPIRSLSQAQRPHAPTTGQHNGTYEVPEVDEDREAVPEAAKVPQTLTHFSIQNLKALVKLVQGCERILSRVQPSEHPPYPEASNITRMHVTLLAFADQSMFYVFNTPQALSASFRKDASEDSSSTSPVSIDFGRMVQAFHWLQKFDVRSQLIIASLPVAIKSLHITSSAQRRREGQESSKNLGGDKSQSQIRKTSEGLGKDAFRVHDEREAAHVALQVFAVLVATVPPCNLQEWHIVYTCHQGGRMVPPEAVTDPATIRSVQQVLDAFEDEMALNLLSRLCEALATRLWISDLESVVGKEQRKKGLEVSDARRSVVDCVLDTLFESKQSPVPYRTRDGLPGWRYDAAQPDEESLEAPRYIGIIAEWLRYLVSKQWDGSAEVDRFSAVGGALEILWCFDRHVETPITFQIPMMEVRFDWLEFATEWLSRPKIANPQHLLTYSFVFSVKSQIACFRALNYAKMLKAYEDPIVASRLLAQMSFPDSLTSRGEVRVQEKLGNLLKSYFVMEIRRENLLLDAIEQLWRRDERELMKPLKVRMGMDEGEEGVDHGGVQQEFFRLAIAEVMNPDYGMFMVDEQSGMSWFRPCSLEPMYKFELVGLLFSLAIYNGLTVPVNFPFAFYRKLQGYEIHNPRQIEDGWPALAKGLQSLLDWSDGDVGDVFARTYEFTAEGPGFNITVDMEKNGRKQGWVPAYLNPDYCCSDCSTITRPHIYQPDDTPVPPEDAGSHKDKDNEDTSEAPAEEQANAKPSTPPEPSSPPSEEASLVTNANREQYVSDYIFWLTSKSIRPQFESFANHFYTCISTRAPSLLNVRDFKRLVEGSQEISVEALRSISQYDGGYHPDHPTVVDFWDTVSDFSPRQIRRLLEFVTASDRIPATGIASVQFSVQKNGEGDERLPTSLTCYGRLLLPQYSGREVLREKLGMAIENCKGFGVP